MSEKTPGASGSQPGNKRMHHYAFAHQALPQICAEDPLNFFGLIGSEKQREFIGHIWGLVCEHCDPHEKTALRADDITVSTGRIGQYPIIVFTMPPPQAITEAYFSGIVLEVDLDTPAQDEEPRMRYFTLEYSIGFPDMQPKTVFAEWAGDSHRNYGAGPPPQMQAFVERIERMYQKNDDA